MTFVRYPVVLADPPWSFNDKGNRMAPSYAGQGRTEKVYTIAPNERIVAMGVDVQQIACEDALLFLWCPNALVLDGVATATCRAWGFEPKQLIPWLKTARSGAPRLGGGHYTRVCTEMLVLAARGSGSQLIRDRGQPGVLFEAADAPAIVAPRQGHSMKPDESYRLIETLADGPYLELFGRRKFSEGWTVVGDESPDVKMNLL